MAEQQPFADLLGVRVHDGEVRVTVTEQHLNTAGTVHGGLIVTLVDMAMGRTVREQLDDDQGAATLQLSLTYLNPAKVGDELVARAEVGKKGATVVLLSAEVVTADGDDIAEAVGTFTVTTSD
ncbi:PaaI family thioesterase [Aestuariimicrobium ganziense]|uniref:PaaI family thioesterase n=1 Tax=Aestuariimicrobium ganziense TaxID=2773677 RepID=UPI001F26708D|nr:PaaI family thioesterase [Aestuariimicrobium ganziense]